MLVQVLFILLNCAFFLLQIKTKTFPKSLGEKEETEYLKKYQQGDMVARSILIERNLRLVAHIIKKYYTRPEQQDDLISIGTIGLIKGIDTFKGAKGTRLATYAAKCIENEILMHFRSNKKAGLDISIDEPIDIDKEGNALSLNDILFSDKSNLEDIESFDRKKILHKIINQTLNPRERKIIMMRYGLFDTEEKTQREIAEMMKISRSYVSRIEKKAMDKLRKAVEMQILKED